MKKTTQDQAIEFVPDLFIIPGVVMLDPDLQPLDSKVYAAIYWLERLRDGRCYASNATIGGIVGSSASGVANALVRLRDKGFVQSVTNENGTRKALVTLVHLRKNAYSNEEGGVPQMSNIGNNNRKELTSDLSDEQKKEVIKVYRVWLLYAIATPEQRTSTANDANSRKALLEELAKSYRLTPKRKEKIGARIKDAGYEMLVRAIKNITDSPWHMGDNDREWKADLAEFLCRSYEKVEEWANKQQPKEEY